MSSVKHKLMTVGPATLLAMFLVGVGCSLVLKIDDECSTDGDCTSQGAGLRCVENLCVQQSDGDSDGDLDADADTDGDVDADSDADEDRGPLYPADLLGGPCTQVVGLDLEEPVPDDAILIGALHPYTGQLEVTGPYFEHATVLAVEEINGVGGFLGPPLGMVICDSGTDGPTSIAAATHLANLGVKAVLGPFSSSIVIAVFDEVFRDEGIAIVSAGANSPVMASVSTDGLIWSTSLPAARQATAIAEHLLAADYDRVAVVNRDDTWGTGMREAMQAVYCESRDCTDDATYISRVYDTDDLSGSLSQVAAALTAFDPSVTVMLTYVEDALTFLSVAAAIPEMPLTSFIWNDSMGDDVAFEMIPAPAHPILCQIMGTTSALPSGMVFNSFLIRYRARWDNEDPIPYVTNYYDATYMLGYAIAAATADGSDFTGRDVGEAMARLSSAAGEEIEAGPSDWRRGIEVLRVSPTTTFDYVGASGDVDFVEGTGSVITPVEAFRFNVEGQSIETLGVIYDIDGAYTAPDYSSITDAQCVDVEP